MTAPIDWQNGPSRSLRSEFEGPAAPTTGDRLRDIYATDPTDPDAEVDTDEAAPPFNREG